MRTMPEAYYVIEDVLVGPDKFECMLTEPEDRVDVVNELNRLHKENMSLKTRVHDILCGHSNRY